MNLEGVLDRNMRDRPLCFESGAAQCANELHFPGEEASALPGFAGIVGQSPALREVLALAEMVASTDSTALLLGETGTGKGLIARAIHDRSRRRSRAFVQVNCAAIPSGLLESELFGHERGAYTGAIEQRAGRLELADQGSLFLDEIGDIPLELQPKLLRVLEEREYERLGSTRTKQANILHHHTPRPHLLPPCPGLHGQCSGRRRACYLSRVQLAGFDRTGSPAAFHRAAARRECFLGLWPVCRCAEFAHLNWPTSLI